MSRGRAERGRDTESKAGSRLWAVSTEPNAGLELTNCKIMTWAEVGRSTDWATQAPLSRSSLCKVSALMALLLSVVWAVLRACPLMAVSTVHAAGLKYLLLSLEVSSPLSLSTYYILSLFFPTLDAGCSGSLPSAQDSPDSPYETLDLHYCPREEGENGSSYISISLKQNVCVLRLGG